MSIHPSLTSALELPAPLYPQRVMEPYVECWCRSGKKWKFCHKDRHKQKPIDIHEHTLQMRKAFNRGYCSHPEASLATCRHGIIKSHTVQRKGGLAAIADSGNHVLSFKAAFDDIFKNDGKIIPKRVGYRIASTFMGFCAFHDNEMFKPIESGAPVIDLETSFLLSFRAMAYEVYQKEMAISLIPLELELDRGRSFEDQAMIQSYYHDYHIGERLGIIEQKAFKAEYDKAYISNDFGNFCFYGLAFDDVLPIVSCGGFLPEVDFAGNQLQILSNANIKYQHVNFNLTSLNGVTVAIFGWTQDSPGPTYDFIRSLKNLSNTDKANAIAILAFEHLENTYLRPDWWDNLDHDKQEFVITKVQSGLGTCGPDRTIKSLLPDQCRLVNARVVQEFVSTNITL